MVASAKKRTGNNMRGKDLVDVGQKVAARLPRHSTGGMGLTAMRSTVREQFHAPVTQDVAWASLRRARDMVGEGLSSYDDFG